MKEETKVKIDHLKWRAQQRAIQIENFIRDKGGYAIDWCATHPTEVIGGVTLLVSGLKASKSLVVTHRTNKERHRIDHTYYDPSTGLHWDLRRKANNSDRIAIADAKKRGDDANKV